jgi:hypothetical protein
MRTLGIETSVNTTGRPVAWAPVIETLLDGSRPGLDKKAYGRQGTANNKDRGGELQKKYRAHARSGHRNLV